MKTKYILVWILLIVTLTSCSSIVDKDLNIDPNNPSEASSDLILTGLEISEIGLFSGEMNRVSGLWSGYFKGTDRQYFSYYNYFILNSDFDSFWSRLYTTVRNSRALENSLEEANISGVISGINKVLLANAIGTATALWGDVPYSEAGDFDNFRTPKYDNQLEIYKSLQTLLDEAISELNTKEEVPLDGSDLFFNGDPDSWIKVAYTLKARLFLHIKNYSKAYENALLGIDDSKYSLKSVHFSEDDAENLYYQFYIGNRGAELWTNETYLFSVLSPDGENYKGNKKTDEDARFNYLLHNLSSVQYGLNTTNDGAFSSSSPFPLITYEENLLILAEAGTLSKDFATGLTYLNELRQYLNGGGDISDKYLSEKDYKYEDYTSEDFDPGNFMSISGLNKEQSLLREILTEKFISLLPQIENFNDLRRTYGEPYALPIKPNTDNDDLPQRFLYPQSEIDRNPNIPSVDFTIFDKTEANK